jgi:hypothetical protein
VRVGPYEIEGEIGRGGAGVVYRASRDGAVYAVKVLKVSSEDARARFAREARLLAELGEAEGFVPLVDVGESPEGPYLVMPFVEGGSLRDRLRKGPLAADEALAVARAVGGALARAHAKGIVHRDVKPENVLRKGDRWLLADLGIGKHFDDGPAGAGGSASLSQTGAARGTIGYMAPEQLTDAKSVGPATDVFALAVLLYECLAGVTPFTGATVILIVRAVFDGDFVPLRGRRPDVPRWLADTIDRALAGDPERRPADAAAFVAALAAPAAPRRRPLVLGAAALGAVALVAAAALLLAPAAPPPSADPARARTLADELRGALGAPTAPGADLVAAIASGWEDPKIHADAIALAERFPAPFVAALEARREPRPLLAHAWLAAGAVEHRAEIAAALPPGDPVSVVLSAVDRIAAATILPVRLPTRAEGERLALLLERVRPGTPAVRGVLLQPILDIFIQRTDLDLEAAPSEWLQDFIWRLGPETCPPKLLAVKCLEGWRGRPDECEAVAASFAPPSSIRAALLYLAIRNKATRAGSVKELDALAAQMDRIHAETEETPKSLNGWVSGHDQLELEARRAGDGDRAIDYARRAFDGTPGGRQRENAAVSLAECELVSDPSRTAIDGLEAMDSEHGPVYRAEVLRRRGELDRARSLLAGRETHAFALAILVRIEGERGDLAAARKDLDQLEARGGNRTLPATHGVTALRAWLAALEAR